MQRLVETVTAQFREAMADRSEEPLDDLLRLIGIYFNIMSDLQPVNRARLVLWADAVCTPSDDIRPAMVCADQEFRDEIERRLQLAVTAGQITEVNPHGLATVIIAMLRGVALQSLIDDHVDLAAARAEIEELVSARLQKEIIR
jgi:AcrR family transcriptional regulator